MLTGSDPASLIDQAPAWTTAQTPAGSTTQTRAGAESGGGHTAILSESLAKSLFPEGSSVGSKIRIGSVGKQEATIIGIVADARLAKPQESALPVLYLNYWDDPQGSPVLFVRAASGRPEQLAETIQKEVRSGVRDFPLWMRTMSSQWGVALMQERLLVGTSLAFGGLGLLVAAVGLFGLLSYFVTSGKTEIGIRMALGAGRSQISWLLIREVAICLALGCVTGSLLLFLISKVFAGLFFGVAPPDVLQLTLMFSLIFVVTLMSVLVPLRRATSIDPLNALRTE